MKPIAETGTKIVLCVAVCAVLLFRWPITPLPTYALFLWAAGMGVHILFAIGVTRDASRRYDQDRLHFVDPLTWGVAVGVFGLVGVALYWLLHLSNLRNDL